MKNEVFVIKKHPLILELEWVANFLESNAMLMRQLLKDMLELLHESTRVVKLRCKGMSLPALPRRGLDVKWVH